MLWNLTRQRNQPPEWYFIKDANMTDQSNGLCPVKKSPCVGWTVELIGRAGGCSDMLSLGLLTRPCETNRRGNNVLASMEVEGP